MTVATVDHQQLTPELNICRLVNGMWQVSGAHGRINGTAAVQNMFDYYDAGLTTWDLADHYGPAEEFIGEFRRQLQQERGEDALKQLQAFTKWVPRPVKMTKDLVEKNINRSLQRMDVESLDLLQFHWWEYRDRGYLDALQYLADLQKAGKIKHLALTNFDTEHLKIITEAGIKIVSNQVQFSLIDRRPLQNMVQFCQEHDIKLLAYGTLAGGLLSDRYLNQSEPRRRELKTASLGKYKQMVDAWGGWSLFQQLLSVLQQIAEKHQVSIANVAVRYVLEQPAVAGTIVGARLGVSQNIAENLRVFEFELTPEDKDKLESVFAQSRNLYQAIGDCGDEYRR